MSSKIGKPVRLSEIEILNPEQTRKKYFPHIRIDDNSLMILGPYHYGPIKFEDMRTSAQVLDWIFQLHQKTWMTPKLTKEFLSAINFVIYPQKYLCSNGFERGPYTGKMPVDQEKSYGFDGREHV